MAPDRGRPPTRTKEPGPVTNVNRSRPTATTTRFGSAKSRLHAVTAVTALAFVAGLSGPAVSAFANEPATPAPTTAASVVHATTKSDATEAAAKAIVKTVAQPQPAAKPATKPATWAQVTPGAADLFSQGKPA